MDSYSPLLERTRVPQPSLQRFAVVSIFEKLRSAPPHLGPDSDPGREAITQCLHSTSTPVVDQSVRELCRLVKDSKMDLALGLLELQSALEGSDSRFVNVFVKGLGFLVRLGFQRDSSSFRFLSSETHPFVKILSCRTEVQSELVRQVLLFMVQDKQLGMVEVCDFLRPFLNFSITRMPFSASLSTFSRNLASSVMSLCCSFPLEAMPVIKLLTSSIIYCPCKDAQDFANISYFLECLMDAYAVILRQLVGMRLLVHEAQLCGAELLETIFSLCRSLHKHSGVGEVIVELSRRSLVVQKELGLSYIPQLSAVVLYLFGLLIQSELEHQQLYILKLVLFLVEWKSECKNVFVAANELNEEILFIFPAINLVSSPSLSVKQVASCLLSVLGKSTINLLMAPKKQQTLEGGFPSISTPESIIFRFLQHLWFQDQSSLSGSFYITSASIGETGIKEFHGVPKAWISTVREYSLCIIERRKSSLPISQSEEIFLTEMPSLLSAIATVLVMHQQLWSSSVDLLAVSGNMDPKLGVPLLLVILFYNYIFSGKDKDIDFHDLLLKLLGILPSLASHPAMIPLIVQTILPMLHKDSKPVLYATATRLLCKTWEINDRVFGSLQGILLPKGFIQFASERIICISMAASVRDVCKRNPDRGVDLILSVSACIESRDPLIQALGLQSLAHLCDADVIDFYTAWDVVAKHVLNYSADPIIAKSICLLLRWGAMDAEAYPEAAKNVCLLLWEVGTCRHLVDGSLWIKARVSALEALAHYEVPHILKVIPNFKDKNMELLTSETNPEVLNAVEEFEAKIMTFEHITRRRFVKEKRVSGSKIEKLVDVFPQVIFPSGNNSRARELPGAALFCLSFGSTGVNNYGVLKGSQDVYAAYENALVEIATSHQLSRNILLAVLSLQSWKPFMQRWLRDYIMSLAGTQFTVLDKTSTAASNIFKSMRKIAEESIPRCAENIALAVGALCMVLPPSAHALKSTASKFLLDWLFQYEHEYRQWSAAISLGLISSCLHVTDHKQKFENMNGLLEVVFDSKNALVKGACGVGLGFSCQDLLTRFEAQDDSYLDKETYKILEANLVGNIIKVLCQMICQFSPSSSDGLRSLFTSFLAARNNIDSDMTFKSVKQIYDDFEEDEWGVAGLVLGLGSSVSAMYRAGAQDAVLKLKALILSWIPTVNPSVQNSAISEKCEMVLSVGSCLALPIVVAFCQKVELIDSNDLDYLLSVYRELISELVSVKRSDTFYQSLLMASCIGAGNLLSCVLNGVHPTEVGHVKDLLELFRKSYSDPHPPLIHLGGLLGVVNALGAGAGILFQQSPLPSLYTAYDEKQDSSYIIGPLLSSPILEPVLTSLVQEMFLVAQNSDDRQMQHHAAWAVSFLRHYLLFKELQNVESSFQNEAVSPNTVSHSLPEDSVAMKLSLWLMHLKYPGTDTTSHANTVTNALRCLSRAPRLPLLHWGAIIRQCMRYEGQVAELLPSDSTHNKRILREECVHFSLVHASQFDSFLTFLDELCDLPRFRALELNLQSFVLSHLANLIKIFSASRLEKLFDDVTTFMSWLVAPECLYDSKQKSLLRVSCWKGLYLCLDETSLLSQEYLCNMENCMEVLFSSLPGLQLTAIVGIDQGYSSEEWPEAVKCLGKVRRGLLLDLLQVLDVDISKGDVHFSEAVRKIQARARLVRIGSIPSSELGKLKTHILNSRSEAVWDVLVEVAAALQHAEGSVKRQWLVDTVEISCVTRYPSTALQFLGLLCGGCSKYMPLLIVDRFTVLSDLPVILTALLSETAWGVVAESVASSMWISTERIQDWVTCISCGDESFGGPQPIDRSEKNMAGFLLQVMHHVCVSLKDYLPPEKQLRLANMVFPRVLTSIS